MGKTIRSFEDLECWKACREVRKFVIKILKSFPAEEKYALTDGMRRAARSTIENIAEGYGRFHYSENIQFCRISRGSLYELIDQFISAFDDKYITETDYHQGRKLIDKAIPLLNGYINYLKKAKNNYQKNTIKEGELRYDSFMEQTPENENKI